MVDQVCHRYGWLPSDYMRRAAADIMFDTTCLVKAEDFRESRRPDQVGGRHTSEWIAEQRVAQAAAFEEMEAKLRRAGARAC